MTKKGLKIFRNISPDGLKLKERKIKFSKHCFLRIQQILKNGHLKYIVQKNQNSKERNTIF